MELITIKEADFSEITRKIAEIHRILAERGKSVDESILTMSEIKAYLRVSEPTIYRYIKNHGLPYRKIGKQKRFSKKDIDKWLDSQQKC